METDDNSVSKSEAEKPPNTPDMSVHDTEAMADSIYEILHCQIPKGAVRRSWKMAEATSFRRRKKAKSFPEGGGEKQPAETPAGKLVLSC